MKFRIVLTLWVINRFWGLVIQDKNNSKFAYGILSQNGVAYIQIAVKEKDPGCSPYLWLLP